MGWDGGSTSIDYDLLHCNKISHGCLNDLSTKSSTCPDHNSTNDGVGWWKEEHFNASDMDDDGFLNLTEFNEYYFLSDHCSLNFSFFLVLPSV